MNVHRLAELCSTLCQCVHLSISSSVEIKYNGHVCGTWLLQVKLSLRGDMVEAKWGRARLTMEL